MSTDVDRYMVVYRTSVHTHEGDRDVWALFWDMPTKVPAAEISRARREVPYLRGAQVRQLRADQWAAIPWADTLHAWQWLPGVNRHVWADAEDWRWHPAA